MAETTKKATAKKAVKATKAKKVEAKKTEKVEAPAKPLITSARAIAHDVRVTPRKARLVIDLVRGKDVNVALGILANVNKAASPIVAKVIKSAAANAINNFNMEEDRLYVAEIYANDGLRMKRFLPRAKGSASGLVKRTSHITVVGQKVSPVGMRVGINRDWHSRWFANDKDFSRFLLEDVKVRKYVNKNLKSALISHVEIERRKADNGYKTRVMIFAAHPAMLIGQEGATINRVKADLAKILKGSEVKVDAIEVKNPDLDATLLAQWIASELENRASFRTAQKKAIARARKAGAKGVKTMVSGRLGGADIARSESYNEGTIPLQTLRADIDYGFAEADTTYGKVGVKVYIYKGEVLPQKKNREGGNR